MRRITRAQAREVDRVCVDDFGLPGIVLMENAALALRDTCRDMLGDVRDKRVAIVCGGGNNGGDGYALARHLANAGADVTVHAAKPIDDLTGDAAVNATVCRAMGLPIEDGVNLANADLIVDALLGTGLSSPPREDAAEAIRTVNAHGGPVLAVDVPSGLDADAGRPTGPPSACVRADRTVTFVAEKVGFPRARAWTGEVVVGDIGCPRAAIERAIARAG